ncbi:MAG: hypothetical protein JRI72_03940 [Deltaproteobacteria bacterium]|nr:hypothetical protein [Deltaproteobacteria bacterium]
MDAKVVSVVVALLVTIGVGAFVLFEILDAPDALSDESYEEFGAYADTTNASAWSVVLDRSPTGASDVNVTCVNVTAGAESYPTFTLNRKTVSVAADAASNFTQVNVTYTSFSNAAGDETREMGGTVWELLPIVALVVVAAIIIGIVVNMGDGSGKW